LYISPFMYLYHWPEDDALRSKHVARLKTQLMPVVLKVIYFSYLRYCQLTKLLFHILHMSCFNLVTYEVFFGENWNSFKGIKGAVLFSRNLGL
jgi:hypothetical protein